MPAHQRAAHTPLGHAWETFERAKTIFEMGRWTASIPVFEKAQELFRESFEEEGQTMCHAAIAAALNNAGQPQAALEHALAALEFYERYDLHLQLAEQRQNIALMYAALGNTHEARRFHALAGDSYAAAGEFEQAGQNKHSAASIFAQERLINDARENFTDAISHFTQAVANTAAPSALRAKATALMQLAYLEKLDHVNDGARLMYQEALEIFTELQAFWEIGTCLEGLAAIEFDDRNVERAVPLAKQALDTFQAHGYRRDALRAKANYRATLLAAATAPSTEEDRP
ncbi:hypothetical protein VVR12_03525 [Rothia sp. LK2588]|uniref:hypothetical protein n=1 Tax=Rothia sp. LK2588 TaxID=3114369 RepID=UPI0034CDBB27